MWEILKEIYTEIMKLVIPSKRKVHLRLKQNYYLLQREFENDIQDRGRFLLNRLSFLVLNKEKRVYLIDQIEQYAYPLAEYLESLIPLNSENKKALYYLDELEVEHIKVLHEDVEKDEVLFSIKFKDQDTFIEINNRYEIQLKEYLNKTDNSFIDVNLEDRTFAI